MLQVSPRVYQLARRYETITPFELDLCNLVIIEVVCDGGASAGNEA
jgi:hypothetical protein